MSDLTTTTKGEAKPKRSIGQFFIDLVLRIVLDRKPGGKKDEPPRDIFREVKETIVFVVVLVLLLKTFVAEAFVIPTGSMAETLWGDQLRVACKECDFAFELNYSARGNGRPDANICICPNCGFRGTPANPSAGTGDRVLVSKYAYHIEKPKRFDVPVFKYPQEPYNPRERSAWNYIKRLIGLPGETIAIVKGDIYFTKALDYSWERKPEGDGKDGWLLQYCYHNDRRAVEAFLEGKFEHYRKTPDQILTVRRNVFDIDHQPTFLTGKMKTRWHPSPNNGEGWQYKDSTFSHSGDVLGWIRYQHLEPSWDHEMSSGFKEIQDVLGYNSLEDDFASNRFRFEWVPDLLVETHATVSGSGSEVTLELNYGPTRFQAKFANDECVLLQEKANGDISSFVELARTKAPLVSQGRKQLRFSDFDGRLTVWLDGRVLDFGKFIDVDVPRDKFRMTDADREAPVRIGSKGEVLCEKIRIWRDVYYKNNSTYYVDGDPNRATEVETYFVQPGHYFCLGDNSQSSHDGRSWGTVPDRLLLGRAILVYWPWFRMGVIE
jgi:signal peptidase I